MSSTHRTHVLQIPSWYPTPSAPTRGLYFVEQARALSERGLKVGVVYPDLRSLRTIARPDVLANRFQLSVAKKGGINTVRVHAWNVPVSRWQDVLFSCLSSQAFSAYVSRFGMPDVIHAQSALWAGSASERLRRASGVPYVMTEHKSRVLADELTAWEKRRVAAAAARASRLTAVSRSLVDALGRCGIQRDVAVVPNMVDTNVFKPRPSAETGGPFQLLAVGSLHPKKGFDVLIRAFARTLHDSDAHLSIVGEGRERSHLEDLANELSVSSKVHLPGALSREEVCRAMQQADVFVLPSRQETFGIVLIEAMAVGLPVIATRSGGPEDLVTEATGRLCPPNNVAALAQLLREGYQTSGFGVDREATRRRVLEEYSVPVVCSRLEKLYDHVVREEADGCLRP